MTCYKTITIIIIFFNLIIPSDIDRDNSNNIKFKNPSIAWKLSIAPGLGQIYNGDYIKSSAIILSEVYALSKIKKYSHLIKTRNRFAWWFIGIYLINIIDAYVDAELNTFPKDNNQESK